MEAKVSEYNQVGRKINRVQHLVSRRVQPTAMSRDTWSRSGHAASLLSDTRHTWLLSGRLHFRTGLSRPSRYSTASRIWLTLFAEVAFGMERFLKIY